MTDLEIKEIIKKAEKQVKEKFDEQEEICEVNSEKVLNAFRDNNITESSLGETTGYGYGDVRKRTNRKSL